MMESAGVLDGGFGPKPMVPTMPPFPGWGGRSSSAGKREYPGTCLMWGLARKENIWGLLGVGFCEALMQGCSNVYITGEFAIFLMSHLMQVLRESFEARRDLYKIFAG